jgi:ATP-dependent Lon protease
LRRFKLFAAFDLCEPSDAYVHALVGAISKAGPTAGLAMFIGTALVLRDTSECSSSGIFGGNA